MVDKLPEAVPLLCKFVMQALQTEISLECESNEVEAKLILQDPLQF
jgi:hypothetical protein